MRRIAAVLVASVLAGAARAAYAFDYNRTGMMALDYTVGPSFIAGGSGATSVGSVEPGVGAGLQFGFSRNLDLTFNYDYADADLRSQAILFGGQWRFPLRQSFCPFVGGGIGFGKPYSGESMGNFALKLLGGIEKPLTENVSLAGILSYEYIDGSDPIGSVHAIEPGVRVISYFGPFRR